jgi:putative DNA primase/helicase
MSNRLTSALNLIEKGFHIIPLHSPKDNNQCSCGRECGSQGKHPRIRDWPNNATDKPSQVRSWWRRWPEANIGIVCGEISDLVVLDMDPRHNGEQSLDKLEHSIGCFTQTTTIMTGGGGKHFYYQYPGPGKLKNSNGKIADGIDIKADGGYVVAPGSLHQSGRTYEWLFGLEEIKPFPDNLLKQLKKPSVSKKKTVGKYNLSSTNPIDEGERNDTLFLLGTMLREKGANAHQIESELTDINKKRCKPPLETSEIKTIAKSASNRPKAFYDQSDTTTDDEYGLWDTEFGNTNEFVDRNTERIRYDVDSSCWLSWDGTRWKPDPSELMVTGYAKKLIEDLYDEALNLNDKDRADEQKRHAKRSAKGTSLSAIVSLAKTDQRVKVTSDELDQHPLKITLDNLTYDLKNDKKLKHNPDHLITKKLPFLFDSNAKADRWKSFVLQIMCGDLQMADFLQQAVGYSLTGLTTEQCLFFLYGNGKNGKTTFVEVLLRLFGEYACKADNQMIMDRRGYSGIPNDVARLNGHRFVLFSEIQEGRKLDEAKVKNLTGGDTITARFLRQEFFDFTPSHKLWLFGNHKPLISGTDDGIWRRIRLIKFAKTFTEQERDNELKEKLYKELPGIFNWALEGLQKWKENGNKLVVPEAVKRETLNYRSEMDIISSFLNEGCEQDVKHSCSNKELRSAYEKWCEENHIQPMSTRSMNPKLEQRGFQKYMSNGRVHWRGLRPLPQDQVEEVEGVGLNQHQESLQL